MRTQIQIAALMILCTQSVWAETTVNERFQYYPVKVQAVKLLLRALNSASPLREKGDVFHGNTDTNVAWDFYWEKMQGVCHIFKVDTEVTVSYTMPKLDAEQSNETVQAVWGKYYSALSLHEKGHAQIAVNAAREIEKRLLRLSGYSNCETLEIKANSLAGSIHESFMRQHATYDKTTEHGKTQGAYVGLHVDH